MRSRRHWQRLESGCWSDIPRAYRLDATRSRAADVGHRRAAARLGGGRIGSTVHRGLGADARRPAPRRADPDRADPHADADAHPTATPTPLRATRRRHRRRRSRRRSRSPDRALPLIAFPQAAFARRGCRRPRVRWGERPAITGRLSSGPTVARCPARGSWVTSRLEMLGAAPVRSAGCRTNARGRFLYTPPAGPSRDVTFAFADSAARPDRGGHDPRRAARSRSGSRAPASIRAASRARRPGAAPARRAPVARRPRRGTRSRRRACPRSTARSPPARARRARRVRALIRAGPAGRSRPAPPRPRRRGR